MSDPLDLATKALREEHSSESCQDGDLGRRRLERALRAAPAKRFRSRTIILLLAATFVGAGAWAGGSGRVARWFHRDVEPSVEHDEVAVSSASHHEESSTVNAPPPSAPSASVMADSAGETGQLREPALRMETGATQKQVVPAAPAPHSSPTPAAREDFNELYRTAHDLHFTRKDPARAVIAWDRYLAAAGPEGSFTLEARYNRAIDLVKLGRSEEARLALAPFARGEYGNYRREEATRLLESLAK